MCKRLILGLIVIALCSCTKDKVNPVMVTETDPELAKFAKFLTADGLGRWRCLVTIVDNVAYETDSIDCDAEKQFDIVSTLEITAQYNSKKLKVKNYYVCSAPRTTYFLLKREGETFTIEELDQDETLIRIYDFVTPEGHSSWLPSFLTVDPTISAGMTVYARTINEDYFKISQPGKLISLPTLYSIALVKLQDE